MSVYIGPWRKSGLFFWRTICFTGWHEWAFRAIAVLGGAADGIMIGFLVGVIITAIGIATTAEVPPAAVLAALVGSSTTVLLMEIGAALGGIAGAIIAYKAKCPECGSCIEVCCKIVAGLPILVIPFVFLPRPGDCAALIPPGCP